MKFLAVYFLATAVNSVLSLPTAATDLPCATSDNKNAVTIAADVPDVKSALTINGNVTIRINDNSRACCNLLVNPTLPKGYAITEETEDSVTAIKFHSNPKPWNEARKICAREGGFLAFATSKEEEDSYLQLMDDENLHDLWIGIHDIYAENDFATVLGNVASEAAHFTWLPGEPNNEGKNERCTHYRRIADKKGLNDINCANNYPFNCKITLSKKLVR